MRRIAFLLILTASGAVFAQAKLDARVKPKTDAKKEEKKLDPQIKVKVDALVVKLGDDDRKVRKQAKTDLVGLGKVARPHLVPYLKSDDPEVQASVKEILKTIAFNRARNRDGAEPDDLRKRALLNGEKPQTTGERKWLKEEMKRLVLIKKREAMEEAMAAKKAEDEKARAEALKRAAEERAKAEAEKRAAEERAKAEAAKRESK